MSDIATTEVTGDVTFDKVYLNKDLVGEVY